MFLLPGISVTAVETSELQKTLPRPYGIYSLMSRYDEVMGQWFSPYTYEIALNDT